MSTVDFPHPTRTDQGHDLITLNSELQRISGVDLTGIDGVNVMVAQTNTRNAGIAIHCLLWLSSYGDVDRGLSLLAAEAYPASKLPKSAIINQMDEQDFTDRLDALAAQHTPLRCNR